jgi:hypothetical protein
MKRRLLPTLTSVAASLMLLIGASSTYARGYYSLYESYSSANTGYEIRYASADQYRGYESAQGASYRVQYHEYYYSVG